MDDKANNTKKEEVRQNPKQTDAHGKSDKKVEELNKRIDDLENQLKRAVADYRNFGKRIEEEKQEFIKFANRDLLLRLFPAFDAFIIAEKYVKDEGLKLTLKKLTEVLKDAGVERIEVQGKEFDPLLMECVDTIEGEENKVTEEARPGFTLYGKTLRPTQVKVGKKKGEKNEENEDLAKEAL
ncbi:MAG: nucleotide exchange factor GrpE [Candidatus Levybacteria bacterium RIFCSPHIGHO2_01_FULL_36_15]|nr:MAG: nucleotide exchange factor GrpE [Candidatus Levybacteria bacterium RIFCSPHIGHO2_01_FULL_36_15]